MYTNNTGANEIWVTEKALAILRECARHSPGRYRSRTNWNRMK